MTVSVLYFCFKERENTMASDNGFEIKLDRRSAEEEISLPSLQVYYVAAGEWELITGEKSYHMNRDDIILVNAMEAHRIIRKSDGLLCTLSIDYSLIASYIPGTGVGFLLNTLEGEERPYEDIEEIFHELVYYELHPDILRESRRMSRLYEFLDILGVHCRILPKSDDRASEGSRKKMSDPEKLQKIYAYVSSRYRDSLSLRELAESMYVSVSSLSRFFKSQTGIYFADYVNTVRLASAVRLLQDQQMSITKVAAESGFTNMAVFSKLFFERYGCTPSEYRRKSEEQGAILKKEKMALLREYGERFASQEPFPGMHMTDTGEIPVDVSRSEKIGRPFNKVINAGSLSSLSRANVQFHTTYLAKELHATHVRIWSVFTRDMNITDGSRIGVYNYHSVDAVLDMVVEHGLHVWLDFGNRPDMALRSSEEMVYMEDVGIHFTSRRAWEALFQDFILHLISRYGSEELSAWIFDMCEDPSYRGSGKYYDSPDYDFLDVFEYAARTIRRLIPGARIGGPVGLPNGPENHLNHFLEEAARRSASPDFLSVIMFPYQPSQDMREFRRDPDPAYEERQMKRVRYILKSTGKENLPVCVVDWNLSLSNRNVLNDSCFRGIYYISRVVPFLKNADMVGLWMGTDWISSHYDARTILNGGSGTLTRDGIRKPAFYAQQFLGRLGGTLLYNDDNVIVTRTSTESFMILAFNRASFHVNYYEHEEDSVAVENMKTVLMSGGAFARDILLHGLSDGSEYIVKTRSISPRHGSIQDEWKRFHFENQLERADVKYFQEICVPYMSMERMTVKGGRMKIHVLVDEMEFQLIHVFRASRI